MLNPDPNDVPPMPEADEYFCWLSNLHRVREFLSQNEDSLSKADSLPISSDLKNLYATMPQEEFKKLYDKEVTGLIFEGVKRWSDGHNALTQDKTFNFRRLSTMMKSER